MSNTFAFQKQIDLPQQPSLLSNEYDVVNKVVSIHSSIKNDSVITEDLKLATLNDIEQEYITEQIRDAYTIKHLFHAYGEQNAQRIFNMLTVQPQLMGILAVNRKDNHLVNSILKQLHTPTEIGESEHHKPRQKQNNTSINTDEEEQV